MFALVDCNNFYASWERVFNPKLEGKPINVSAVIEDIVAPNSTMVTDEHHAYNKVVLKYNHMKVNHRDKEYVRKEGFLVHTNSIEGYWNILRKQIDGIHTVIQLVQNIYNATAMIQHSDVITGVYFKMKGLLMLRQTVTAIHLPW